MSVRWELCRLPVYKILHRKERLYKNRLSLRSYDKSRKDPQVYQSEIGGTKGCLCRGAVPGDQSPYKVIRKNKGTTKII